MDSKSNYVEGMTYHEALFTQGVSVCVLFVKNEIISASKDEIVDGMNSWWFALIDRKRAEEMTDNIIEFAIKGELIELVGERYMPTDTGWALGKDWWNKIKDIA